MCSNCYNLQLNIFRHKRKLDYLLFEVQFKRNYNYFRVFLSNILQFYCNFYIYTEVLNYYSYFIENKEDKYGFYGTFSKYISVANPIDKGDKISNLIIFYDYYGYIIKYK